MDLGGKKKKILIAVVLLAVLGGAGYYFLGPMFLSPESAEKMAAEEAMETADEMAAEMAEERGPVVEDVIATDNIRDLMLQSIKQYSVRNEKAGQIFVVEGKVVNNFPTPKELIKVEASLFDDTGVAVATKKQYCGAGLALYELQLKSAEEIERALNSKENIAINNTNIPPGGEVEFMVVFYDPPPPLYGNLESGSSKPRSPRTDPPSAEVPHAACAACVRSVFPAAPSCFFTKTA